MLSNLLRIFVTKKAIDTMQAESAKQLAEQGMMQEPIPQFANYKEFEEYMKRVKQEEKEWVRYYLRPMMALERAANFRAFFPILLIFGIGSIGGSFYLMFYGLTNELERQYFALGIAILLCGIALLAVSKYLQNYWENTMCLYYSDRICIKRYRKKDVVITYDEVKECIKKKKIKIHNGRFEYPYEGGWIYIYTWGNSVQDGFYKFMNDKCGLKMPRIGKKEKDVVRRTGIGWTLYFHIGGSFMLIDIVGLFICCIGDAKSYCDVGFWDLYADYIMGWDNFFGILAVVSIIIGITLKFVFYFPARKYFAKYKDIIKVSLF